MCSDRLAPWIENVAAFDVFTGQHHDAGENSMLIQIGDPAASWWPTPKVTFREQHRFEFLDADCEDNVPEQHKIQTHQAREIMSLLRRALENDTNVVVHCMAGICRSGAVAEVGVAMGFRDVGRDRIPNLRVKRMLMAELGETHGV